jgi:hypothetical protein
MRPIPKGVEEVLDVFIDNPKKKFKNDDEIVAALQCRKTSLTREQIIIRRKWLFEKKYIKHDIVGGPYPKRYILNPERPKWPGSDLTSKKPLRKRDRRCGFAIGRCHTR